MKISISYIPKDFNPESERRFKSVSVVRTDSSSHGSHGIVAQVLLPEDLPVFGSSALKGYPINVRIIEGYRTYPEAFVAIMAHEVAHVLLTAIQHPKKNGELYVELIPLISGFRNIVLAMHEDLAEVFGYLSRSQVNYISNYITELLNSFEIERGKVINEISELEEKLKAAMLNLSKFRIFLAHLNLKAPTKMKAEDARKVVAFNSFDYLKSWER